MASRWVGLARHLMVKPWPVWLTLGGFGVAAVLGALFGATPIERAAWASTILQLAGIGNVAWGLHTLRKTFPHSRFVDTWLRELRGLLAKPTTVSLSAPGADAATASESAELTVKAGPGASHDQRLTILEEEVDRLRDRVGRDRVAVGKRFDHVETNLTNEGAERRKENAALTEKVEDFAVGGLRLEVVGLAWLVFGVLLGTLPEGAAVWMWEHGAISAVLFGVVALGWLLWKLRTPREAA